MTLLLCTRVRRKVGTLSVSGSRSLVLKDSAGNVLLAMTIVEIPDHMERRWKARPLRDLRGALPPNLVQTQGKIDDNSFICSAIACKTSSMLYKVNEDGEIIGPNFAEFDVLFLGAQKGNRCHEDTKEGHR